MIADILFTCFRHALLLSTSKRADCSFSKHVKEKLIVQMVLLL